MQAAHYSGRLDDNGRISLPLAMRRELGLRAGDSIELLIFPHNGDIASGKSSTQMPRAKQRRMNELLARHREGDLAAHEKRELEALVWEAQLLTVEKAKGILRKKRER